MVHLGNGRYFDPLLGLPLQPNPAGGVPTVPQSLNRYAATSLGPVGVAEGVVNGWGYNPLPDTFSILKGALLDKASLYPELAGYKYIGQVELTIQASWTALTRKIPEAFRDSFGGLSPTNRASIYERTGLLLVGGSAEQELRAAAKQLETAFVDALPSRGFWKASVSVSDVLVADRLPQYVKLGEISSFKALKFGLGPLLDATVGGYLQYLSDRDSPYLTSTQKGFRAGISGLGSVGTSIAFATAFGCTASVACGVAAGIVGTISWIGIGQPLIFNIIPGLSPAPRNIKPLNAP